MLIMSSSGAEKRTTAGGRARPAPWGPGPRERAANGAPRPGVGAAREAPLAELAHFTFRASVSGSRPSGTISERPAFQGGSILLGTVRLLPAERGPRGAPGLCDRGSGCALSFRSLGRLGAHEESLGAPQRFGLLLALLLPHCVLGGLVGGVVTGSREGAKVKLKGLLFYTLCFVFWLFFFFYIFSVYF